MLSFTFQKARARDPNAYQDVWANDGAANVTIYIVQHFSTANLYKTATMGTLSPDANAAVHGYIVADAAYYTISSVTGVQYRAQNGTMVTLNNPDSSEYNYPWSSSRSPMVRPKSSFT